MSAPPLPSDVKAAIAAYHPAARARFMDMREIVHAAAADTPEIGPLTETLKWGEPAYLTEASGSGITLRVAWKPGDPDRIGVYLNCRTSLVEDIRTLHPGAFEIEGTRGLMLAIDGPLPTEALDHVARLAQGYHRRKRGKPLSAPLRYRPHHFLCSLGFEGKGYSDAFTANMEAIVMGRLRAEAGEDTEIEVVSLTDDICGPCPKRRGTSCTDQEKIERLDASHARALRIDAGDRLTWAEAQVRILERVRPETLDRICVGCAWLEQGMCKAALERLHDTSISERS